MTSREKILKALSGGPETGPAPHYIGEAVSYTDPVEKFCEVLVAIGGAVVPMSSYAGIREYILQHFDPGERVVSVVSPEPEGSRAAAGQLHPMDNVEVAEIRAHFGVAENGAVWITDEQMVDRVVPFICQHLIVLLEKQSIVATMHDAYERINANDYDFGTFIAGPSKTADIEQALVLGAHGPKTMTVFLMENKLGDS
jgi:L-lactate dehydrogenase complex protein LldG